MIDWFYDSMPDISDLIRVSRDGQYVLATGKSVRSEVEKNIMNLR